MGRASWLKTQCYFVVGGPSSEKPMLIELNAGKDNRIVSNTVNDQTLKHIFLA